MSIEFPRDIDVSESRLWAVTFTGLPPFVADPDIIWCHSEQDVAIALSSRPGGKAWVADLISTTTVSEWSAF